MPLTQLAPPYQIFTDRDGSPLDNGFLYFGVVNQNPETNPIQVYYDSALTQPAAQPIRTINGYPSRNGSPAILFANSRFSVTVRDKKEALVVYGASLGPNELIAQNNLSDLTDASVALTNLGITSTAAEINVLDGVTATTAEINVLDGVTATTAEINVLDGVTGIASEAEAEAGTDNTTLMTPLRARGTVMYRLPRAFIPVIPNNNTTATFNIATDPPVKTNLFFFSDVRNTVSTSSALRYRVSTDSGSTWSSYFTISSITDWSSDGVWGELELFKKPNLFAGIPGQPDFWGGFRLQTNKSNGTLPFSLSLPAETVGTSLFNKVEFSFTTGNLASGLFGWSDVREVGI